MSNLETALRSALEEESAGIDAPIDFASDAWRRGRRRHTHALIATSSAAVAVCGLVIGVFLAVAGLSPQASPAPASQPTSPAPTGIPGAPPWWALNCLGVGSGEPSPLAKICIPTRTTGFPKLTLMTDLGAYYGPLRPPDHADFVLANQLGDDDQIQDYRRTMDEQISQATGPLVLVQVWLGGSFAHQGNPQLGPEITGHTTALGQQAAISSRPNGSSRVLVTAHGYDIIAQGSGNNHGLTPITVRQLVDIIDSIRGL